MSTPIDDNDELEQVEEAQTPRSQPVRIPGPGLLETFLWLFCFVAAQAGFSILVLVVALFLTGQQPGGLDRALGVDGALATILLPGLLSFMLLIPVIFWRLSPESLRKLNFSAPTLTQVVILLASTVAMLTFGSFFQQSVTPPVMEFFKERFPTFMQFIEGSDVHQLLSGAREASIVLMLFFIAVVPAIGEEFLFRGLIGRGLVARWGVVPGVLLTSLLFALVHVHPAQVISLIPLALFIHVAYLATRTFWAPMLVHFTNNAIAVVLTKYSLVDENAVEVAPLTLPEFVMMTVSVGIGLFGAWALFAVRTEYQTADGETVVPSYPTVEAPPSHLNLRRVTPRNGILLVVFAALLIVESIILWESLQFDPNADAAQALLIPFRN